MVDNVHKVIGYVKGLDLFEILVSKCEGLIERNQNEINMSQGKLASIIAVTGILVGAICFIIGLLI